MPRESVIEAAREEHNFAYGFHEYALHAGKEADSPQSSIVGNKMRLFLEETRNSVSRFPFLRFSTDRKAEVGVIDDHAVQLPGYFVFDNEEELFLPDLGDLSSLSLNDAATIGVRVLNERLRRQDGAKGVRCYVVGTDPDLCVMVAENERSYPLGRGNFSRVF